MSIEARAAAKRRRRPVLASAPLHLLSLLLLALLCTSTSAQLINGQFFSPGLAIINAPAPDSQHHVGSPLPISIDVSGNGRLSESGRGPDSTLSTGFISLNIFLISAQTNVNITVSDGPQLLAGEQGSTVKHLNWNVPDCVSPGDYNLTYYERSRIDGVEYFSIHPTPLNIQRSGSGSGSACPGATTPEPQPQASSPRPGGNPFRDPNFSAATNAVAAATPRPSNVPSNVVSTGWTTIVTTVTTTVTTVLGGQTVTVLTTTAMTTTVPVTVTPAATASSSPQPTTRPPVVETGGIFFEIGAGNRMEVSCWSAPLVFFFVFLVFAFSLDV